MSTSAPAPLQVLNLHDYIAENLEFLSPPVCNRMIFNAGILRIMIVGGPNKRKDYHLNLGEEIFFQVKGDMCLKVMECDEPKDVVIKEGEFFVLPGKIAHSPQRFENTVGIVIERQRNPGELDGLRYYVDESNQQVLWQRYFPCTNLGVQLVPLIKEFFASDAFSTRVPEDPALTPAVEGGETWEPDAKTLLSDPFVLASRCLDLNASVSEPRRPPTRLANREFIVDLVSDTTRTPNVPIETEVWVWLLVGSATVTGKGKSNDGDDDAADNNGDTSATAEKEFVLTKEADTVLLPGGLTGLEVQEGTRLLVIYSTAC